MKKTMIPERKDCPWDGLSYGEPLKEASEQAIRSLELLFKVLQKKMNSK